MKTFVGEYVSKVPTQSEAVERVLGSIRPLPAGRWLLAVSGGRDSMVLFDAFVELRRDEIAAVATFNHGTGAAATRAATLVERTALRLGVPVVTGGLPAGSASDEAAWRRARWRFLRGWSAELRAEVVTAHSWDDQVETVLLRLLRDAGPRGLAGMLAGPMPSEARRILRPFLDLHRADIAAAAAARHIAFVEDPSNASLAFARNRVRHEILPALERASPGFSQWCYDLSSRAAALRRDVTAWVDGELTPSTTAAAAESESPARQRSVGVRAQPLVQLPPASAALVWPEVAARVGVVMDRRGLERLVAWAPRAQVGGRIQLSGGGEVLRTQSAFVVRHLY